jgi:hypothetical protein
MAAMTKAKCLARCMESPINSPVSISLPRNGAVNSSTEMPRKRFGPQTEEGKARALANLRAPWPKGVLQNPGGRPKQEPKKRMGPPQSLCAGEGMHESATGPAVLISANQISEALTASQTLTESPDEPE